MGEGDGEALSCIDDDVHHDGEPLDERAPRGIGGLGSSVAQSLLYLARHLGAMCTGIWRTAHVPTVPGSLRPFSRVLMIPWFLLLVLHFLIFKEKLSVEHKLSLLQSSMCE